MPSALSLLKSVFGYDSFRHHQADIIEALVNGQDVMTLMPTGGGKSICYQIPALLRKGTVIVISPLIALMQDQVQALGQLGIHAAFLNSTLTDDEQHAIESRLRYGDLDLLYMAPERLLNEITMQMLEQCTLALFAIDEAHCVSQWGHDFRKEYQQLSQLHRRFPDIPRIALTATADTRTRREIIEQLSLEQARIFIHSFDRPNIYYAIHASGNNRDALWRFLQERHSTHAGIIYCLSRKQVDTTARWLQEKGRTALPYHAGLPQKMRQEHQQRFLREDACIIVATIAFGMGIDKPDVRFVAHLSLPRNIESYYQETGRAGRDGLPAEAWMSYGMKDLIQLRLFTENSDANEHFKRIMRQKTDAMLGLCETTGCRRQALLAYFNEVLEQPCGNCDNCLNPPQCWDGTVAAQKALSCIYRTGQRFGAQYLIHILSGKNDERICRNGHDRLSTFGIGTEHSPAEWRGIFRQLLTQGYIISDTLGYGVLKLTSKAGTLLRRDVAAQTVMLRDLHKPVTQRKTTATRNLPASLDEAGQALFSALRELRRKTAQEQNVPPYIVFSDKTLGDMAAKRPVTDEQFLQISGVGTSKLARYGETFMQLIRHMDPH